MSNAERTKERTNVRYNVWQKWKRTCWTRIRRNRRKCAVHKMCISNIFWREWEWECAFICCLNLPCISFLWLRNKSNDNVGDLFFFLVVFWCRNCLGIHSMRNERGKMKKNEIFTIVPPKVFGMLTFVLALKTFRQPENWWQHRFYITLEIVSYLSLFFSLSHSTVNKLCAFK